MPQRRWKNRAKLPNFCAQSPRGLGIATMARGRRDHLLALASSAVTVTSSPPRPILSPRSVKRFAGKAQLRSEVLVPEKKSKTT